MSASFLDEIFESWKKKNKNLKSKVIKSVKKFQTMQDEKVKVKIILWKQIHELEDRLNVNVNVTKKKKKKTRRRNLFPTIHLIEESNNNMSEMVSEKSELH